MAYGLSEKIIMSFSKSWDMEVIQYSPPNSKRRIRRRIKKYKKRQARLLSKKLIEASLKEE